MNRVSLARLSGFFVGCLLCFPILVRAQVEVVTFDDPSPPGAPDSLLNGVFDGIDFGSGQWRWSPPYGSNPTNNVYFASSSGTSRSFTFAGGPRVLESVDVYTVTAGTMTLTDGVNPPVTRTITVGSMQRVTTGWSLPAQTVTVAFTAGWALGVDDITHRAAGPVDTTPPAVTMTAPQPDASLRGSIVLVAEASDNVGVAGVQFFVDGAPVGQEDVFAPYSVSWDTTTVANGTHTLTARARDASGNTTTSAPVVVVVENAGGAFGYSLRFSGTGAGDVDRVKIRIDDPTSSLPGPPADVGATDFTLELWIKGSAADNPAPAVQCGANDAWINGNIIVDRDRYNQDRNFGVSVAGGRIVFGVEGQGGGNRTICGVSNVLDGQWHHVAVQRRRSDGWMWLFVDGVLEAQADGPNGDISYPDNGVPGNFCNGPCVSSDPFLVIGAEKHDAGPEYPSFSGFVDELRLSTTLRYSGNFNRPAAPFTPDAATVALYHFDEGDGDFVGDSSGAFGGPSDGVIHFGGSPTSPQWVADTPFTTPPASQVGQWAGPYDWPIVAINAALLHTGEVLVFDGGTDTNIGGSSARLWNPATNAFTPVPTASDIFCSGHSFLPDGRLLVVGGNVDLYIGLRDTNIFDPVTSTWTRVANMAERRWYPTTVTLADGRVVAISGSTNCNYCIVEEPEIYDPVTNTWTMLQAPLFMPTYPHLFLLPDGRLLVPGSDEEPMATYVFDVDAARWTVVDPEIRQGGAAVMYRPGRVMKSGSASDVDIGTSPTVRTTYVIDMNEPSPAWRETEPMAFPRGHHTLTILPDGNVLVVGGGRTTDGVNLSLAVLEAEMWSPETESWTTMAAMRRPRLYHSISLLLPDGRVLSAGGGRFVGFPSIDQLNAEIYSPPYLFKGRRPVIASAPSEIEHGSAFFVETPDAASIQAVNLVAPGAVTHQVDMSQRFVQLEFEPVAGGVEVTVPGNANVVPPGYYMLFLIDSKGVPSIAKFVRVLAATAPAPVPSILSLTPDSVEAGSGAFTLTVDGTGFVSGSTVLWNGAERPTTFVSSTRLTAAIPASDVTAIGSASVIVSNPAPGGGLSNGLTFEITPPSNPVPIVTSLSPASVAAGDGPFTLTVDGSGFVPGSVVRWNGAARSTTFVSATRLTAAIAAADIASPGDASVTVSSPAPGGGLSNELTFEITPPPNPVPSVSSLSPSTVTAGGGAFTLTVNGTGFVSSSVVLWNGAPRPTTYVSSTRLTAAISTSDITADGDVTITVSSPAPGGGTSNALTLTVQAGGGNPPPVGLVAAFSFDEGSGSAASDASGNGNHATLSGATWTAAGRFGGALQFNGTSSMVTVPDSASLDLTTGMTLEAWVYPTVQPSGWRTVITKETSGGVVYYLHAGSSSSNRPATGVLVAGGERILYGGSRLPANTWTHLAATYDGSVQRLYINGVQVASRNQTGPIAVSNGAVRIGGNAVWGEFFQGRIDEVRIYNRALSAAEIQQDMATRVGQ